MGRGRGRGRGRGGRGRGRGRGGSRGGHSRDFSSRGSGDRTSRGPTSYSQSTVFVKEEDVGIFSFTTDSPGFTGVLKERYTDFVVNEIGMDGQVAVLTQTGYQPPENKVDEVPDAGKRKEREEGGDDHVDKKAKVEGGNGSVETGSPAAGLTGAQQQLLALIGQADYDQLIKLRDGTLEDGAKQVLFAPSVDKNVRAQVHGALREAFPSTFMSDTLVGGGAVFNAPVGGGATAGDSTEQTQEPEVRQVRVRLITKGNRDRAQFWPPNRGKFCQFIMVKQNRDLMGVIKDMAKFTRTNVKSFEFAGNKDKRGVTTQVMTAYKVSAERIARLSLRNVLIGHYEYVDEHMYLGKLKGNRFHVVLRNVAQNDDDINKTCQAVKENGFINYFGLQRFGTAASSNHLVGKALIQGKWKEAVDLILAPREEDNSPENKVRQKYKEDGNLAAAIHSWPRYAHMELQLLQALQQYGKEQPNNALQAIPRTMRTMYVHAYQSYLFNKAVSERIQAHGLKPQIGDFVIPAAQADTLVDPLDGSDEAGPEMMGAGDDIDDRGNLPEVITLTAENIDQYTLYDVVVPIPGKKVTHLPDNSLGETITRIMSEDDVSLDRFSGASASQFGLGGSYRHMLRSPGDFTWEILPYNSYDDRLHVNAFDLNEDPNATVDRVTDGKYKAVKLSFSLSSGTYATMLVRELTRGMSTSPHAQALATQKHQKAVAAEAIAEALAATASVDTPTTDAPAIASTDAVNADASTVSATAVHGEAKVNTEHSSH